MAAGMGVTGAISACVSPVVEPPAEADDTESSTGTEPAPTDTGSTDDPPPSLPWPSRPAVQTCRFDGWAPGLLPPLQFVPSPAPPIPGARVIEPGPPGILWVGTEEGALFRVAPDDHIEPVHPLPLALADPITGLAFGTSNALTVLFVRSEQQAPPRTQVNRYTLDPSLNLVPDSSLATFSFDHDPSVRTGAGLDLGDGLLWIPLGDGQDGPEGGNSDDPRQYPGNLLRLDVSTLATPYGYQRPDDNPLADQDGPDGEAWAWGLRDPSGCVQAPNHAGIWCADRGAAVSEINLVNRASHLGWPWFEGIDCQRAIGCDGLESQLPLSSYRYDDDDCGVGPVAYVDQLDDELDGATIYGDRCSGRLFAARPIAPDRPSARAVIGLFDPILVAIVADPEGGLWAIDANGQLGHLVVNRPSGTFPQTLSSSHCFEGPSFTSVASDLIPYSLNAPLWTDNSHKDRYLVVPPSTQIQSSDDGTLHFPEGSIILKNFSYPMDPLEPERFTPVETRVMIRRSFAWEFHSYAWNEEGTDAQLLQHGETRTLLTTPAHVPTVVRHTFPSRSECGYCHGTGRTQTLGPRLDQLVRTVHYDGTAHDQLRVFNDIGLLDTPASPSEPIADYRDPELPDADRARAYLHANCGHCHRPGGWTPPGLTMDLRWATPTPQTQLCGVPPQYSSTFAADYRVAAGDPSNSLVWLRLSTRGLWQMPPLATSLADPMAYIVRDWIRGLEECPEP